MTQIISAALDRTLRRGLRVLPAVALAAGALGFWYFRSGFHQEIGATATQPIAFRHDLHVREIWLECEFCHAGARREASAGMPSAETCLVCHDRLWRGTAALQPLYTSVALVQPIAWQSLYALPDHARFHHGAHAAAGVDCVVCHGDVASMQQTKRESPTAMAWCLDCHFAAGEQHPGFAAQRTSGAPLERANPRLADCSTCHY